MLASSSSDHTSRLWNTKTWKISRIFEGYLNDINNFAWSPDGRTIAAVSEYYAICFWDANTGQTHQTLTNEVESVAWSPDGKTLCSGSMGGTILLLDANTGKELRIFKGHNGSINSIEWSPDGQQIASGADDKTVRIWDLETERETHILEAHTDRVISVSFFAKGKFLGSLSRNGTIIIWRTDTWTEVAHIDKISDMRRLANLAVHPTLPLLAVRIARNEISIWDIDFNVLLDKTPTLAVQYVNAKIVLIGDSGVGKSGLGIRIAEKEFRKTDSTHGAQFWYLPVQDVPSLPEHVRAELTLWDLAGQPEYRLIHQLFLDDTDVALLLFDCSDPNDPFRGVHYWAKVLKKHVPSHAIKLLVSARCDVSPVTVDYKHLHETLAKYELDHHFKTSAKEGDGVETLFQYILEHIPWHQLPRTTTPHLFHVIREFLLEQKGQGKPLIAMEIVTKESGKRFTERQASQAEIDTVVALMQARGIVYRVDPRPHQTLILLRPELINQYASTIIQSARNHSQGIGAIPERDILTGNLIFAGFERLASEQERIVLEATAELLIRHDLCFREMGFLVFPSQINVTRPVPPATHPRTEVAYRFSGGIETIYASLVVRLSYTNHFRREEQWKYAVEFSRDSHRLGFAMQQVEEGTGELEIYFAPEINEFDRVTFIRFVTDHLRAKGIDIQEQIRLYCPKCEHEITNRDAIAERVKTGYLDIPCQYCSTTVMIPESIEERYRSDRELIEKQQKLAQTVKQRTNREVQEFKTDQYQYTQEHDHYIHILHLADLHLENSRQARKYRAQLESDLLKALKVKRLEYLVISGDIANYSTETEYQAAFEMLDGLVKRFGLDANRVVIVPGNHDLNWDLSAEAYIYTPKHKLPNLLTEDYILAGEAGALKCDQGLYQKRFANFNAHFYKRAFNQEYLLDYADQILFVERPDDKILFLGLNSCWQIDHHFRSRAGVNMDALSKALDKLQDDKYDGWLKIAVFHHPVTGKEMMNDEFLQLLTVHGFQICMHGHLHEAQEGFYKYDSKRGLHIIGAGTFGAPAKEQVSGIPLQYNLLTLDPEMKQITVETRKKEKPDGAWKADARWGEANNPTPRYKISLRQD
jgi:small GTP-binding protein